MTQTRFALLFILTWTVLAGVATADEVCPIAPCPPGSCDSWEPLWLGSADVSDAEICQDQYYNGNASSRCGAQPVTDCELPEHVLHPVGQTFMSDDGVYRIDLMMQSRGDRNPITVKLWRWVDVNDPAFTDCAFDYTNAIGQGDDREYNATRAGDPLWSDTISLPGSAEKRLVSLYPQDAPPATCGSGPALYYLEIGDPFEVHPAPYWLIRASYPSEPEAYLGGDLRMDGWFRTNQDLWMRIYSAADVVALPQIASSEYGCPGCDPIDECNDLSRTPNCDQELGSDPLPVTAIPDVLEPADFLDMIEANLNSGACTQSPCLDAVGVSDFACAALHAYADLPGGTDVAWDVFAAERRYRANPNAIGSGSGPWCRAELNNPDTNWGSCEERLVCQDSTHEWDLRCDDDSDCQGTVPCQPSDPCFCAETETACVYGSAAHGWMLDAVSAYNFSKQDWSESQRRAAKALLIRGGMEFWPIREIGSFNRALAGSLTFYALTNLMTASEIDEIVRDPEFTDLFGIVYQPQYLWADWRDYADGNWNRFLASFDHQEDSAHYGSLTLGYVLAIDRIRTQESGYVSIWDEPGFQSLVEREYQLQLPTGPQAVFGDSRGIAQNWATRTLLFVDAWDRLGDERYRLAAYRSADFQKRYFYGHPGGNEAFRSVYSEWLHMIYLHRDLQILAINENPIGNDPLIIEHEETVALEQLDDSSKVKIQNKTGGTVGQSFEMPPGSHGVFGVELRVKAYIPGPVKVRLFRGAPGSNPAPIQVYEDHFQVPSSTSTLTIDPAVSSSAGEMFYVEAEADFRFELKASRTDLLPDGTAFMNGSPLSQDVWLRVGSLNGLGSTWTQRPAVTITAIQSNPDGDPPEYWISDPNDLLPDKLILRSGYEPSDLHAAVNLVAADYSHRHEETGAVVSLVDDGALLLTGSARMDREAKHVSGPIARRHLGQTRVGPADVPRVTVDTFLDSLHVTHAAVSWDDLWGWDFRQEREFFFAKNAFLVVRDRSTGIDSGGAVSSGVLWRSKELYRFDSGATDWAHLFHQIPNGVNDRKYKNFDRYVYTELIPDDAAAGHFSYVTEGVDLNPETPRVALGTLASGSNADQAFTSVLVPHGETEWLEAMDPDLVTVVHDASGELVLEIQEPGSPDAHWLFVLNENGGVIDTTGGVTVKTDARVVMARVENGTPTYTFVEQATCVDWHSDNGDLCRKWPVASSAEVFDAVSSQCCM